MLARLRLDALIGSDHQQDQINPANPSEHIPHKTLVAWHIHKSEAEQLASRPGKFKMGESQVDSDSATLLFRETVGIDSGEGFDQRGFSVIDMSSGADDD